MRYINFTLYFAFIPKIFVHSSHMGPHLLLSAIIIIIIIIGFPYF